MTATVTEHQGRQSVTLVGEFDECFTASGTALIEAVAHGAAPVEVDLSGVTFFSAAGARWLVALEARTGDRLRIVAASDTVREVLDVCGIESPSRGGAATMSHLADSSR